MRGHLAGGRQKQKLWRHYQRKEVAYLREEGSWSPKARVAALQKVADEAADPVGAAAASGYSPPRADPDFWVQPNAQGDGPQDEDDRRLQLALAQTDAPPQNMPGRYRTSGLPGSPSGGQHEASAALYVSADAAELLAFGHRSAAAAQVGRRDRRRRRSPAAGSGGVAASPGRSPPGGSSRPCSPRSPPGQRSPESARRRRQE